MWLPLKYLSSGVRQSELLYNMGFVNRRWEMLQCFKEQDDQTYLILNKNLCLHFYLLATPSCTCHTEYGDSNTGRECKNAGFSCRLLNESFNNINYNIALPPSLFSATSSWLKPTKGSIFSLEAAYLKVYYLLW